MTTIRLFLLLTFCVFSFLTAEARRVDVEKAEKVARSYARATPRLTARREFRLSKTVSRRVERTRPATRSAAQPQNEPMFYVFTMNGNSGFILVAGDDVAKPVLGYSDAGTYDENNPNLAYWMETLSQEIAYAIENNVSQDEQIKAAWDAFAAENDAPVQSAGDYVEPLIKTKWSQYSPYNNLCPVISDGKRAPTGCVATAMAQIMKYHEYPTTRTVTIPGYTLNSIKINQITGSTTYRWSDMSNTYSDASTDASNSAVAELMYHCGVSVIMNYALDGSAARSSYVATALKKYFDYDAGMTHLDRSYYSYIEWIDLLKTELEANRPVLYSGHNSNAGHAFICDGYDANGLFHFNWGWGGYSDGYFEVSATSGGIGGFNQQQRMTIGIQPDNGGQSVIRLGLSTFSASKSSLNNLTENFDVSAGRLTNIGLDTITNVYLGVLLYRQDGSYYNYTTDLQTLNTPSYYYWPSRTLLSGYSLPPDLPVGTYKLYPAFSASSEKPSIIYCETGVKYISVVVKADGSVTLTAGSDKPNLSLVSLQAVGNIYQNETGNFTAEITNNGTADYNSKLTLKLGDQTLATDPAVIPAGTSKTVEFSATITLSPGNYQLSLWYDPDNTPQGVPSVQLGDNVPTEVKAEPAEEPDISLVSPLSFQNKDAVNINNPDLTLEIKNTGGLFNGIINVFIYPENSCNAPSLGSFGAKNIRIEKDETQQILFNNSIDFLSQGTYHCYVFYYLKNQWIQVGGGFEFTAIDPSLVNAQTPTVTSHPQSAEYVMNASATALSVTANVSDGGTLSYQWYRNTVNNNTGGAAISGATSATYTPPTNTVRTSYYYVAVTNINTGASITGQQTATVKSNTATVTVKTPVNASKPAITSHPQSAEYNMNATATALSVTASVSDGGALSYQWYRNTVNNNTGGAEISGATSASYTPPTSTAGVTYYYVVATNTNTSASITGQQTAATTSYTATVKVKDPVDAKKPNITAQLKTATYTVNATATALVIRANVGDGGTLSYQWYRNTSNSNTGGIAISGATSASYTPPTNTVGVTYYYVVVTNTNTGANITGQQTAATASNTAAITVKKISQSAPKAPTLACTTATSITLNTISGNVEYSRDGANWQDSPTFDGLAPNTPYTFYARYKESDRYTASPSSAPSRTVNTNKATLNGKVTISGEITFGETLTAVTSALASTPVIAELGTLSYQWKRNNAYIPGATAKTYTLVQADIATTIAVTVATSNTLGVAVSDSTVAVAKKQQVAPKPPTLADKTAVSIILETVSGMEYSRDSKKWQDSPTFDDLTPDTEYTFYARTKETGTHNASPASAGLTVRTYAGTDAKLVSLFVNSKPLSVADNVTELDYQSNCNETSVALNIEQSIAASVSVTVGDVEYKNQLVPLSEDATTVINIKIVSGNKQKTNNYRLTVANPLDANEVLFKRWDDVVAVNSNSMTNGEYRDIEGVRWTVGGRQSEEWYIQISNGEDYSVEINHAGKWHHVCGKLQTRVEKIIAYPNPVTVGENMNLQLPHNFTGGYVDVVSLAGSVTKRKLPLPATTNTISVADWAPGVYLLNIVAPNGDKETLKVIVNN